MPIWFKTKRYGWGWVPATWQGWLLTALFIAMTCLTTLLIPENSERPQESTLLIGSVILIEAAVFLFIVWKTGEKPRWRWGKD